MANKKWALYYASLGLGIIPAPKGEKGPVKPGWPELATSDPEQISAWWDEVPDQNIGFVAGKKSHGIIVIDLDVDGSTGEDGLSVIKKWASENGKLPKTWQDITPRGGTHLYYHSDKPIENNKKILHEGIEIRASGLNTILPPSLHPNGRMYRWKKGRAPWEIKLAEANETVLNFVGYRKEKTKEKLHLPAEIQEGSRNNILFRAACNMQSTGFPDEVIETAISKLNEVSCRPPLSGSEVENLIGSALKYKKGGKIDQWINSSEQIQQEMLRKIKRQLGSIN